MLFIYANQYVSRLIHNILLLIIILLNLDSGCRPKLSVDKFPKKFRNNIGKKKN